ncbi:glycine cleavage system protein H [Methylocella sp. CPCC 101449]|uniref:glycine cleavage system protein H n=1 Tax=Methylocella sp. CPCC 101449 TaxID=2987531 RepID=UPI00288E6D21|nr:glycine cleavage system protein H [Methylocella sp. CPCC 101449]MDT2021428.1 glycine cleavage system protein H [Methylocella sp. CPCC 101449]
MVTIQDCDFPEHLHYDVENQIWYEPLADGTVRTGFTRWAANLMGDVLVFTPKRIGRDFERDKSFAVVEGGKWVGSARAAFAGVVVAHNERLEKKPELLNQDAYGEGWMLIVRPAPGDWQAGLVTGAAIAPIFEAWFDTGAYKDRTA